MNARRAWGQIRNLTSSPTGGQQTKIELFNMAAIAVCCALHRINFTNLTPGSKQEIQCRQLFWFEQGHCPRNAISPNDLLSQGWTFIRKVGLVSEQTNTASMPQATQLSGSCYPCVPRTHNQYARIQAFSG